MTRQTKPLSRLQWTRPGTALTVYDGDGTFIVRLEDSHDIDFMNRCIMAALQKVAEEQKRRKTYTAGAGPENAPPEEKTNDQGEIPA